MQDVKMTDQVAGLENDGPSKSQGAKMQDMKMQDMKMQDMKMHDLKIARHENRRHETLLALHLPGASLQRCNVM